MSNTTTLPPAASAAGAALTTRIQKLRDELLTGLVERDVAIRLALLAALAGEHLLLVGPPGTAKSMVARRLHLAFQDASYFERLLTRFTVPEELFGPLSIKGLEEDRYERLTSSYLPTASVAFLDEIFKANSAILNALLTLLNEREFDNGAQRVTTPLLSVVGASNELGESEELDALYDRFLLRLHVGPVSQAHFKELLKLRGQPTPAVPPALQLTRAELRQLQADAENVEVPEDILQLLTELRDWCTAENIPVSDRRWRKIVKLLQVSARSCGRTSVSIWDCWLLQHCIWYSPEDREKVYDWYAARVGSSAAMDPSRLTKIVVSWEGRLKADQESRSQARDAEGRLLYKGADGKVTHLPQGPVQAMREGKQLYLAPPDSRDQHGYSVERSDGGKGFTRDELSKIIVHWNGLRHSFQNWPDKDSYLANVNNWHMLKGALPEVMEPTRHRSVYVLHCLQQIDELELFISQYKALLLIHIKSFKTQVQTHLWVTPDFAEPAAQTLEQTRQEVDTLLLRLDRLRKGFELLPREEEPAIPSLTSSPS